MYAYPIYHHHPISSSRDPSPNRINDSLQPPQPIFEHGYFYNPYVGGVVPMIFASAPPTQISQISKFSRAYTNPVLKKSSDVNNNQYNFRNNPQTKIRAKDSVDSNNKVITHNKLKFMLSLLQL